MIDVYWWSKIKLERDTRENFGDALVPFLLEKLTPKKFQWRKPNKNKRYKFFKKRHYIMIGSIIRSANSHSIVWGGGIITSQEFVNNAKFLAVRGPRTRNRLLELGYKVPKKYGDPALLLAYFYQSKKTEIRYKYGIVPHYVDYENTLKLYEGTDDILIIDLLTNNTEETLFNILKCEYIISSSLHGVIVAHALGIPALWTKISNKLYGDDIKFYDYFESLNMNNIKPLPFKKFSLAELDDIFYSRRKQSLPSKINLDKVLKDLVQTFPFKKTKSFRAAIKRYHKNV